MQSTLRVYLIPENRIVPKDSLLTIKPPPLKVERFKKIKVFY